MHFAKSGKNSRPGIPKTMPGNVATPFCKGCHPSCQESTLGDRVLFSWCTLLAVLWVLRFSVDVCGASSVSWNQGLLVKVGVLWRKLIISVTLISISVSSNTVHKNGAKSSVRVLLDLLIPRKRGHVMWKVGELAEFSLRLLGHWWVLLLCGFFPHPLLSSMARWAGAAEVPSHSHCPSQTSLSLPKMPWSGAVVLTDLTWTCWVSPWQLWRF